MSKIKTLILTLITSLVLVILGVGSISSQAQNTTKKYIDSEFGMTFDYPYDWSIANTINNPQNTDPFTIQKRITLSNNVNFLTQFNIDIWRNFEGLSAQDWFDKYEKRFHNNTSNLINGKDIKISNIPALLLFEEAQNQAHGRITMIVSTQDSVVRLDYYTNEGGLFQSEFVDVAKSIVFTQQQPVVNVQGVATNFPDAPFLGLNKATLQIATCCGWVDPNPNTYPCDGGNCTWWAKYKRPDVGNVWGNACQWRDRARQVFGSSRVGLTARVGAIAVFQPWNGSVCNSTTDVGHVAFVTSVGSGGNFQISQMSWQAGCTTGDRGVTYPTHKERGNETLTFIYADTAYQGEFVGQTFQGTMMADTIQHAQVQIKNTGTQAWDSNTKIYAMPLDQANPFYDPSWLHPYRIASSGVVQPGAVGTFDFILHAPLTPGQYRINFAFVQEGITWFTNPTDSTVWYPITVTPSVGSGSTRWPLFVEAFNRNGGTATLGYPNMIVQWSGPQNAPVQATIQGFSGGAFIIHDEQKDTPPGSVPAYVLSGPLLQHFQSLQGSSSWLGAGPSSDQFTNALGQQQSNFPNGYVTWDGTTAAAHAWPVRNVTQWYAEYHNGTNLNAAATWIQNEASISATWSTNAPGNGQWGVWSDHFAVRWTRRVTFNAGDYTFIANASDSMRVWIDNTLLIDAVVGEQRMSQSLSAGDHDIRVEFIEDVGDAAVNFRWEATTSSPTPVTPSPTPSTTVTPSPTSMTPSPTPSTTVTPSPTSVTPSSTPVTSHYSVYLPMIQR